MQSDSWLDKLDMATSIVNFITNFLRSQQYVTWFIEKDDRVEKYKNRKGLWCIGNSQAGISYEVCRVKDITSLSSLTAQSRLTGRPSLVSDSYYCWHCVEVFFKAAEYEIHLQLQSHKIKFEHSSSIYT